MYSLVLALNSSPQYGGEPTDAHPTKGENPTDNPHKQEGEKPADILHR